MSFSFTGELRGKGGLFEGEEPAHVPEKLRD
jgi:hypothetical protein